MFLSLLSLFISTASAATFTYNDPTCTAGFVMTSTGAIVCASQPTPPIPPIPPIPPDPQINCTGFTNTLVMRVTVPPAGSGNGPRVYNTQPKLQGAGANFGTQDALVIVFQAPPAGTAQNPSFTMGVTHAGGTGGASTQRTFALSTTPCDFTTTLWTDQANVMAQRWSSGYPQSGRLDLTPGREYFLNVKNYAYGSWTCSVSPCNIFVSPGYP